MGMSLFFFKQMTSYELHFSDWSSDVCSSDLPPELLIELVARAGAHALEVSGREELLKLVEHEVVGRRLRIPEVRERHVRAREPHKLGPHVRILPAGGLVDVAQRQRSHV